VDNGWWFYVKQAVAKRFNGQPREAMADFEKAMSIVEADKNISQDVLLGIIDKLQETLGADETILRVKTLLDKAQGAQATRWKTVLARLYLVKKEYPTAIDFAEQARKESATLDVNQQVSVLNVAGSIYMMSGNYPMARTAFEQLLAKRGDDLAALNNLAFLMAEHVEPPDVPKAMEYCKRAYDIMTKNNQPDANVLDTVGWVYVLSGGANLDQGISYLDKSIATGEIAEAQYHYGEALIRKNLPEYAKTSLTRANELIDAKTPVDEVLKRKVEQALLKVNKMLGSGADKQ